MIVDEKERLIKAAKILRITFVVLFALLAVWIIFVALMNMAVVTDKLYHPLAMLFLAVSLLMIMLQTVSNYRHKNGMIAGVANIICLLAAAVFTFISEQGANVIVVTFYIVPIVLCVAVSSVFVLRGLKLTYEYPKVAIALRSVLLASVCAVLLLLYGRLYYWLYGYVCIQKYRSYIEDYLFLTVTSLLAVFIIGAGIVIFIVDGVWWCDSCNRKNKGKAKFCCGCGKQRPAPQLPVKPKREKRVRPVAVVAATATQQTAPEQTAQQADWFCPECGTSNLPYAKFCESCGTKNPVDLS